MSCIWTTQGEVICERGAGLNMYGTGITVEGFYNQPKSQLQTAKTTTTAKTTPTVVPANTAIFMTSVSNVVPPSRFRVSNVTVPGVFAVGQVWKVNSGGKESDLLYIKQVTPVPNTPNTVEITTDSAVKVNANAMHTFERIKS